MKTLRSLGPGLCVLVLMLVSARPAAAATIYFEDFEGGAPGSEWSDTSTDVTPVGGDRFLGQFGAEEDWTSVSLSLSDLGTHDSLTLSFDLYLAGSWDGNRTNNGGEDQWILDVDGVTLLGTTFSNRDRWLQAYPEGFPGGGNQAGTGAVAEDTLGFYNGDSTYSVSFTFAHLDPNAVITFQSWVTGNDEKFGLDNVHVTTPMPEPGSMLLFGSGMALVGLFGRRKGRSS